MKADTAPYTPCSTHERGFSLVELMTVVVIVAILAAIAIPSYNSQIRKSRRTEARTAILDLATREERFFSLNNAYTNDPTQLGYAAVGSGATFPINTTNGYYTVNIPLPTAANPAAVPPVQAGFQVIATAIGQQAPDTQCATFTVDQTGRQTSTNSGGADSTAICWQ